MDIYDVWSALCFISSRNFKQQKLGLFKQHSAKQIPFINAQQSLYLKQFRGSRQVNSLSLKLRVLNGKVPALHTKLIREPLPRLCSHLPERQLNRKALPLTRTKLQENTDRFWYCGWYFKRVILKNVTDIRGEATFNASLACLSAHPFLATRGGQVANLVGQKAE